MAYLPIGGAPLINNGTTTIWDCLTGSTAPLRWGTVESNLNQIESEKIETESAYP